MQIKNLSILEHKQNILICYDIENNSICITAQMEASYMSYDYEQKIKEKAYYNYLNRTRLNYQGNAYTDWIDAEIDQHIEDKIRDEAYLHYLGSNNYPLSNWDIAQREILERINFLAFYLHESNINRKPLDNWIEAKKLYVSKF